MGIHDGYIVVPRASLDRNKRDAASAARRRCRQDKMASGVGDSIAPRKGYRRRRRLRRRSREAIWARVPNSPCRARAWSQNGPAIEEALLPRLELLPEAGDGAGLLGRGLHLRNQSLLPVWARVDGRIRSD